MKIALYQGPGTPLDVAANIETLGRQAERASAEAARLLIAPEMILSGYNIGPAGDLPSAPKARDGASAQAIAELRPAARTLRSCMAIPSGRDGHIYNSSAID